MIGGSMAKEEDNVIVFPAGTNVPASKDKNLKKRHNIPIDTLVEVEYDENFGFGACRVIHARLWVVGWGNDPDGTPLYNLAYRQRLILDRLRLEKGDIFANLICGVIGSFTEEKLTVVPLTLEIQTGEDVLKVEKD